MEFSRTGSVISIREKVYNEKNPHSMCHTFRNIIASMSLSWKSLEILSICSDNYKGAVASYSCLSIIFPLWLLFSCSLIMFFAIYFREKTGMDNKTLFSIIISIVSSHATYCTLLFKKREFIHL